jgi:hypothetical protein
MGTTDSLHANTVAMLQGSSHLRVQGNAEMKFGASAKYVLDAGAIQVMEFETCTGKTGNISNRGITHFLTTSDSEYTLGRPVLGYVKKIVFGAKNDTSNIQKVLPTSKGIKVGGYSSTNTGIFCSSFAAKVKEGAYVELLGLSSAKWLVTGKSSTNVVALTFTSATG